jgi:putative transposase
VKRSLLVEAAGGPLAVVLAGANVNVHDIQLLAATLEAVVVERPPPTPERPQHLCVDLGDDTPTGAAAVASQQYRPHLRRSGKEQLDLATGEPRFPARRWVVERTLAWLSKCRALLIRYDKRAANFRGLLHLACALLWFRRLHRLSLLR